MFLIDIYLKYLLLFMKMWTQNNSLTSLEKIVSAILS